MARSVSRNRTMMRSSLERTAGRMPANRPTAAEIKTANPKIPASRPRLSLLGMSSENRSSIIRTHHWERTRPTAPPQRASSTPSTITKRTRCPRLAPSACRIASSRCRAAVRTDSRMVALAVAMSSTNAAPARRTSREDLMDPTVLSLSGSNATVRPSRESTCSRSIHSRIASRSARAPATWTPGRSRPTGVTQPWALSSVSGSMAMGSQISVSRGKSKPSGATPTMTCERPLTTTVSPRTLGRPPSLRCQRPWEMTATRSRPGASSSLLKVLPI